MSFPLHCRTKLHFTQICPRMTWTVVDDGTRSVARYLCDDEATRRGRTTVRVCDRGSQWRLSADIVESRRCHIAEWHGVFDGAVRRSASHSAPTSPRPSRTRRTTAARTPADRSRHRLAQWPDEDSGRTRPRCSDETLSPDNPSTRRLHKHNTLVVKT